MKRGFWPPARRRKCGSHTTKFLPEISRGGGPREARWRGSSKSERPPPPGFAWSPSPAKAGEEFCRRLPSEPQHQMIIFAVADEPVPVAIVKGDDVDGPPRRRDRHLAAGPGPQRRIIDRRPLRVGTQAQVDQVIIPARVQHQHARSGLGVRHSGARQEAGMLGAGIGVPRHRAPTKRPEDRSAGPGAKLIGDVGAPLREQDPERTRRQPRLGRSQVRPRQPDRLAVLHDPDSQPGGVGDLGRSLTGGRRCAARRDGCQRREHREQ